MFSKSAKKQKFGQISQSGLNRTNDLVAQQTRLRGGAGVASFGFASAPSFRQGTVGFRAAFTGADGIPAATDDGSGNGTLGSADDVTDRFYQMDGDANVTSAIADTTFTAYNESSQDIAGNTKIICAKVNGIWVCIWEDCPTGS